MATIDAILFDVGNVLIEWDPRHLYRKLLSDDSAVEHFLSQICTLEWHFAHDQGVSFEENAAPLKQKFPEHSDLIDQWALRYVEMSPREVVGMAELVASLKTTELGIHGLSNMPSTVYPMLRDQFSILGHLETIVVSGDERVCKPEPRIYELALDRMGTRPEKTLFVDDSLANIHAAERLGFKAHHFSQVTGLERALADLGVVWQ